MSRRFQIATLTPGLLQPSIAIATHRAGELALLDFEFVLDEHAALDTIVRFNQRAGIPFGLRLGADTPGLLNQIVEEPPANLSTVILTSRRPGDLKTQVGSLRERNVSTLLEARCLEDALAGEELGVDALVAKGHEAGGRVADETTFILLQRFQAKVSLPVWAHGGVGLHTAAACVAAGAAGLILDSQLALTRESPLPEAIKARIASMDGSETICVGDQLGETYRIYFRPGQTAVKELQAIETELADQQHGSPETLIQWSQAVRLRAGWESDRNALLLGQDAAFAASLAKRFRTVGGVLHAIRQAAQEACQSAAKLLPLAEGSPLAQSHGTRFPILQGPMTRVSDVPEFAASVAEGGGLPFLALALMRGPEVQKLLAEAKVRLGSLPWGVGILGFVPPELRQEQMNVVLEYRPPFALIAGGRPDQALALEQQGIPTYLHVPSPGLLEMFIRQGARRFVFEGRECGGHVGPRTSFVLWNQMIEVLLNAPELDAHPEQFHIVFAAGIHDALSGAMVSALAAPLAARGARIGALIGTAYLFTQEAVKLGAILETFQQQAGECRQTVLLETGPGHATRCVATPFAVTFAREKRRLSKSGLPAEEIRLTLEEMNLGRLRIASKGVTRNPDYGQSPSAGRHLKVDREQQLAEGMYMIGQVAGLRHTVCTVEQLHQDVSIAGSNRLQDLADRFSRDQTPVVPQSPSDVALVGMACLLPKAPDLLTFWDNILHKVDAVGEVPVERWDPDLYFDADPKAKDKIYSKWGGFLDDVAFDPMQYGMPPATLRSIEPAQLLTLEVVRAALKDAGYQDRSFARERTSVILGAGGGAADLGLAYGARSFIPVLENLPEFQGRSEEILERLDDHLPEWTEDSFAGILTNVSAGRVANRFDLGGSNYTVDAACASSLAAVSLALKELEGHTSDMVIVGGIDTMQNPFTYLCFSKTHALSPRGKCRTFDESADGIAISEGIAMMVLKRLADAERDGDRIYAVIKGAGSSSDGKDRGLTAPRPEGQARALRRAYAKAGISPATVGLVEAHGTGTVAGDGAEVQALTQVFSEAEAGRQNCALGSVKSMVGHTKCTAGAAGLLKAALALHHKVLPATLGVETPNPRARFPETPFFVNSETRPWLKNPTGDPRRAGVSAFGFGGTNFHIVMEEYTGDPVATSASPGRLWSDELFLWSGSSRQSVVESLASWEKSLAGKAKPVLRDLAFTAWKHVTDARNGSHSPSVQLAIVASSLEDLKQKITSARQELARPETGAGAGRIHDPRGIYFSEQPLAQQGKLAFLFPGQGSQYPHMLQDLLVHFPEIRQVFEQAVRALGEQLEQPLTSYVFPPPSFNPEELAARQKALTRTNIAQPALGAAGLALFGLLQELGLRPDMAAGHSYGEYVALAAAGVFSCDSMIALSEARGRFIVEGAGAEPGTMAAVEADADMVGAVLKNISGVSIANSNAPRQIVISGTRAGVENAVQQFTSAGITARLIPVACAFHSALVAPAQQRLAAFLASIQLAAPEIAVYSNTTAKLYPEGAEAIRERLVEHLVQPVEFSREIESMYSDGARIFVEVGPRGVLSSLVDKILADRPKLAVASNQSGRPGLTQLLHLLAQLASQGVSLKLDRLYRDRSTTKLDLAAIEKDTGEKALSPSMWLVNGARAKPAKDSPIKAASVQNPRQVEKQTVTDKVRTEKPVTEKLLTEKPVTEKLLTQKASTELRQSAPISVSNGHHSHPATVNGAPASPALRAEPAPASSLGMSGDVPQVMAQFQQMMTRFLDVQKTVMLTYLGAEGGAPAFSSSQPAFSSHLEALRPSQPPPISTPAPIAHVEAPVRALDIAPTRPSQPEPAAVAPVPEKPAPPRSLNVVDLKVQLLSIVSDRTGYPIDMLDLKLDLEADLGIDSIKRVEILGTFQQSFASLDVGPSEGLMENLAGVRTLQAILDRVEAHFTSKTTDAPALPTPVLPQSPLFGKDELTARLLTIVSERTGYPPEMLDLALDLEADLGIDSIKRVEILGTFQQSFADAGAGVPPGVMEKLSGVRTLQGILDRVSEQFTDSAVDQTGHLPVTAVEVSSATLIPQQLTPSQVTPVLDQKIVTAQLLGIVSDRTGYPPEMLDLDLDLEADLGIDSIKRVEILGTFQQSFAALGISTTEGITEKLAGARNLRSIVERVMLECATAESTTAANATADAAIPAADVPPAPPALTTEPGSIQRFTLSAVDAPLRKSERRLSKSRVILITEDGLGVAQEISDRLNADGHNVALIASGRSGLQHVAPCRYEADLTSPASAAELVELITRQQGPLGAVLHLLPVQQGAPFSALTHQGWKERVERSTKSLFYLAKAAGKHLQAAPGESVFLAVTGMGGSFLTDGSQTPVQYPDQGGVAGLMKTLALEWADVSVKAVDVNPAGAKHSLASQVLDELQSFDRFTEIGYHGARRLTLEPTPAPLSNPPASRQPVLDRSSVVLITGGARGIAALAASRFAETWKPTLVLAGRSPLPHPEEAAATAGLTLPKEVKAALMEQMRQAGEPVTPARVEQDYARLNAEREVRGNLEYLRQLGARVHYHSVDVRDPEAFGALIDGIYHSFGRLDGVIHAVGVIEDKLVLDKTPESFDRVFDTKADSAFVLSQKLRPESLQFLVFFSSVAGRFGNRGQGDYAAANEVLNKLAVSLNHTWPAHVVAMNWGPWDSPGMVSAELRKQFAERGVELIPPGAGLRMLEQEISLGHSEDAEVVIGGAGWQPVREPADYHRVLPLLGSASSSGTDPSREYVREFDPARDFYLQDHRLDGHPVLPLAVATEFMAEAVAQGWPDMHVSVLRDLRLLQGIVFERGSKTLRAVAKATGSSAPGEMHVEVAVYCADQPKRVHYRATVELTSRMSGLLLPAPSALAGATAFGKPVSEIYRDWLFHGPVFQGIRQVNQIAPGGIQALLATSSPADLIHGAQGQWLIDPLMFDSALQLLVVWARKHWDMTALPSGFGSYRRLASSAGEQVLCEMRILPNTGEQNIHADIFFQDALTGRTLAVLEDMQGACSRALNRLAGGQPLIAMGIGS